MSTRYYKEKYSGVRNDTPISLDRSRYESHDSILTEKEFWCSCNRKLMLVDDTTREHYCNHCSISVFPEHTTVRSSHGLVTSDTTNFVEKEIAISYTPEPTIGKPQVELKGGFAALSKKGTIKITSYQEGKG